MEGVGRMRELRGSRLVAGKSKVAVGMPVKVFFNLFLSHWIMVEA